MRWELPISKHGISPAINRYCVKSLPWTVFSKIVDLEEEDVFFEELFDN